jgi:ribonuclease-3
VAAGDLVVIFRTRSDVEASIVRGLLEAHGVPSVLSSNIPHSIFPVTVNELGEVRISVRADDEVEAKEIIDSHRTELPSGAVVRLRDEFDQLERAIDYRFRDRALAERALTHTSRANEDASGGVRDNESLEFLGDAVLGFLVADMLYREFPEFDEGQTSKIKASIVSAATLARQAEQIALGRALRLGRGEERTGGRQKQALLSDAYEALIAAIYLDGGIEQARAFVTREFAAAISEVRSNGGFGQDHKSALQEHLQSQAAPLPVYRLSGTLGPEHRKLFHVEVVVRGEVLADGRGASKKEAEQDAARRALERLGADGGAGG